MQVVAETTACALGVGWQSSAVAALFPRCSASVQSGVPRMLWGLPARSSWNFDFLILDRGKEPEPGVPTWAVACPASNAERQTGKANQLKIQNVKLKKGSARLPRATFYLYRFVVEEVGRMSLRFWRNRRIFMGCIYLRRRRLRDDSR